MVNVPVVNDKLAIRVALYGRDEGGYIDGVSRPGRGLRGVGSVPGVAEIGRPPTPIS